MEGERVRIPTTGQRRKWPHPVQGGGTTPVPSVHVGTGLDQGGNDGGVAGLGSAVQRGEVPLASSVHILIRALAAPGLLSAAA